MGKSVLLIITAMLLAASTSTAAQKPKALTQKADKIKDTAPKEKPVRQLDLAKKIVESFGLSEGLSEKPVEKEYFDILSGRRALRFEAEDVYDKLSDSVSVREQPLFGTFTGKGWIHGTTVRTAVHFKVMIPIAGIYTVKTVAKGNDQLWSLAGKAFKQNSGDKFTETTLGKLFIPAGDFEFNAIIPPDGAIDSFSFTAPSYSAVEPSGGWVPSSPLTHGALQEALAALMDLEQKLPTDLGQNSSRVIPPSTLKEIPESVYLTDSKLFGFFTSDKWLRAYNTEAEIVIPVDIESAGVYRLRARALGENISGGFAERLVKADLKQGFNWADFGTFRLVKGVNSLKFRLQPGGGIDTIELTRKHSLPANYAELFKSSKKGNTPVTAAELDAVIKQLAGEFKTRK